MAFVERIFATEDSKNNGVHLTQPEGALSMSVLDRSMCTPVVLEWIRRALAALLLRRTPDVFCFVCNGKEQEFQGACYRIVFILKNARCDADRKRCMLLLGRMCLQGGGRFVEARKLARDYEPFF